MRRSIVSNDCAAYYFLPPPGPRAAGRDMFVKKAHRTGTTSCPVRLIFLMRAQRRRAQ